MHTAALVAQTKRHVRFLVLRPLEAQFAELRSILLVGLVLVVDEEPYGERARCRACCVRPVAAASLTYKVTLLPCGRSNPKLLL